jgi:hypothetical protein
MLKRLERWRSVYLYTFYDIIKQTFYQEKLDRIRQKRSMKANHAKRVKTEHKPVFIPGEVIDLT